MSTPEHTPLTEAEREIKAVATALYAAGANPEEGVSYADLAIAAIEAARTSTATADTGCDHDSHYMTEDDGHDHWRCLKCGLVTECRSCVTADTGLRERVEALAAEWDAMTPEQRLDASGFVSRRLRDLLATPASTEDRADNEGAR